MEIFTILAFVSITVGQLYGLYMLHKIHNSLKEDNNSYVVSTTPKPRKKGKIPVRHVDEVEVERRLEQDG